jgi:hypothetical protein
MLKYGIQVQADWVLTIASITGPLYFGWVEKTPQGQMVHDRGHGCPIADQIYLREGASELVAIDLGEVEVLGNRRINHVRRREQLRVDFISSAGGLASTDPLVVPRNVQQGR